jgi:hypothetical protein
MPQADWSKAERWVWEEVCAGKIADFHQLHGKLDQRFHEDWGEDQLLRADFLREIFYDKSLGGEIPPEGVRIVGAWFRDQLALPVGRLHRHLWLLYSRFDQGVDFSGQTIEGWLVLEGSFAATSAAGSAAIDLRSAKIDGSVISITRGSMVG